MSIKYIHREHLDEEKYNQCIATSLQSKIYAFSWYLDIVCDNWDVLVLDDYEAVMPIPWRKKYGIKYVYPPFWVLQLGVFSNEVIDENENKDYDDENYNKAIHLTIKDQNKDFQLNDEKNEDEIVQIQKNNIQHENKKLYYVLRIIGIIETNTNINVSFKLHIFNNYI